MTSMPPGTSSRAKRLSSTFRPGQCTSFCSRSLSNKRPIWRNGLDEEPELIITDPWVRPETIKLLDRMRRKWLFLLQWPPTLEDPRQQIKLFMKCTTRLQTLESLQNLEWDWGKTTLSSWPTKSRNKSSNAPPDTSPLASSVSETEILSQRPTCRFCDYFARTLHMSTEPSQIVK